MQTKTSLDSLPTQSTTIQCDALVWLCFTDSGVKVTNKFARSCAGVSQQHATVQVRPAHSTNISARHLRHLHAPCTN